MNSNDRASNAARIEVAFLVALSLAIWVPLVVKAVRGAAHGNDLTIYIDAARAVLHGESPYANDSPYMYPPFFAYLLIPIAGLSNVAVGLLWAVGKVVVFTAATRVLVRDIAMSPRVRRWLIVAAPLLVYRFADSDLATGNCNIYLLGALVLALHSIERGARATAGVVLAAVAAVKLAPALVIVCLARAQPWRFVVAATIALASFLTVPALGTSPGIGGAIRGFARTSQSVFEAPTADDPAKRYVPGQSLRALLHRFLTKSDATAHDSEVVTMNLVDWDPSLVEWIYRTLALFVVVIAVMQCRDRDVRWIMAWACVSFLVASPYSRKAAFVFLLPAWIRIAKQFIDARHRGDGWGWTRLSCSVGSLALGQLTTRVIWGKRLSRILVGGCVCGLSAMLLWPLLWMDRNASRRVRDAA